MTEKIIQYLIYRYHNFKRVIPNVHTELWGGSEVDALYWTDSNRVWFYEIKLSKSDFKNDFKKKRHKQLLERDKNIIIKPKYFNYVCYGFNVLLEEIPDYAGLIMCNENRLMTYPQPLKKAPLLWNEKLTQGNIDMLVNKITYRYLRSDYDNRRNEYFDYIENKRKNKVIIGQ